MLLEKHSDIRRNLIAILVSLFLACILTWPVVISPFSQLVGHPGNDTWNHVWGYWWVQKLGTRCLAWAYGSDGVAQWWNIVFYRYDAGYFFLAATKAPVFAYNFVVSFRLPVRIWSMALGIKRPETPLLPMQLFIFEMTPHIMGQAYNDISETVCAGGFSFHLGLFCLMERPNWKMDCFWCSLVPCVFWAEWYYGLFTAIAALILLVWAGATQRWLYRWTTIGIWLTVVSVLSLPLFWDPFSHFKAALGAEDALVTRDPGFVERSLLNHNITDVIAFFNPSKVPSPNLFCSMEKVDHRDLYWLDRDHPRDLAYIACGNQENYAVDLDGVIFSSLVWDPTWMWEGAIWRSMAKIPLPFLALYKAFPSLIESRIRFRFTVGVELALLYSPHMVCEPFRGRTKHENGIALCAWF